MSNQAQGTATFHLFNDTEYGIEEYLNKFHEDNIIDMKFTITLSDGSVHILQAYEFVAGIITSFVVDGEEIIKESVDMKKVVNLKEKATKLKNSVTKIAL